MDDYEARMLRLKLITQITQAIEALAEVTKVLTELAEMDVQAAGLEVDEAKARSIRLSRRTH